LGLWGGGGVTQAPRRRGGAGGGARGGGGGMGGGLARRFAEICETTRCSRRATVSDQKMNPHSTQCKEKALPYTLTVTHTPHI